MSTRNFVPRSDGEGGIGTSLKKWLSGYFKNLNVDTTANIATLNMTGAINQSLTTMASASTMNIGAAASNYIIVTGTTTITAFDTIQAGTVRTLRFSDTVTVTYNASTMIIPGATNIVANAGDVLEFTSGGSGVWRCTDIQKYQLFRGCRVYNNSGGTQTVSAGATAKVVFNTVDFDTSSFWNVTNTRIEIPAGISKIRLYGTVRFPEAATTNNQRFAFFYKNGSNILQTSAATNTLSGSSVCISSGIITVSSGDYIELYAGNSDSASKSISQASNSTFFSMEVVA
ncbi:MAG: hypothetical protein RLY43_2 [Bacteroidota bacterium]|jgi:hypothetical protein